MPGQFDAVVVGGGPAGSTCARLCAEQGLSVCLVEEHASAGIPVQCAGLLSLAAFDDLQRSITAAGGDRDAGIQAFCDQHEGDGWMLPETLCLADLGLTRTVNPDDYDDRARVPQPVRSRMGERFLDWQLAQTPEESWAECERHAQAILEGRPEVGVSSLSEEGARSEHAKRPLERPPAQGSLFDFES